MLVSDGSDGEDEKGNGIKNNFWQKKRFSGEMRVHCTSDGIDQGKKAYISKNG